MPEKLPIVYSAHHAGRKFGAFSTRVELTPEQQFRYSDYGTAETAPRNGTLLVGEYSRGLIDLNRAPDNSQLFPTEDFARPTRNKIWLPGQELTEDERKTVLRTVYEPYHDQILNTVRTFTKPGLVVAWDNTAHYIIGKDEAGNSQEMRPFILSNRGREGSTEGDGETTTCDPAFLQEFGYKFAKALRAHGLPDEIYFNFVFKGGYIAQHYNTRTNPDLHTQPVQSFQLEYDSALTHDQQTLEPNLQAMQGIQSSFEHAIYETYSNFL
jgi:N-formylglutamate amidohydrolase